MLLEEVTARTGSALPRSILTLFQRHVLLIDNVSIVYAAGVRPEKKCLAIHCRPLGQALEVWTW